MTAKISVITPPKGSINTITSKAIIGRTISLLQQEVDSGTKTNKQLNNSLKNKGINIVFRKSH